MADQRPWIDFDWLKVGPFLGDEEERLDYEKQKAIREAQQGPSKKQYDSYIRDQEFSDRTYKGAPPRRIMPTPVAPVSRTGQPMGGMVSDVGGSPNAPPTGRGGVPAPSKTSVIPARAPAPGGSAPGFIGSFLDMIGFGPNPDPVQGPNIPLPEQGPMPEARPEGGIPADIPEQTVVQQEAPSEGNTVADIQRQKELIDSIYPQRPDYDFNQEADAEAMKDRERANYLAQLAFFSGITQGAGGQWQDVGRGLAASGQAYTEGFDRYQKALSNKAGRNQKRADAQYADSVSRTDAAVKLYGSEKDLEKERMTEARTRNKDRQTGIDEYFKKLLDVQKGNDMTPQDPAAIERTMKDWRLSRRMGDIVDSTDVSDK